VKSKNYEVELELYKTGAKKSQIVEQSVCHAITP
jgi:hypothetical protein